MKTIQSVNLECTVGANKEYRLSLEDLENGSFEVVALWGAIGSSLKRTVKFSGDEAGAKKEFDKILRGQLKKNYVVVGEKNDGQDASSCGSVAATVQAKQVVARIPPMLCGAISRAELEKYLVSDVHVLQEKYNGLRKFAIKVDSELTITNKQGQPTGKGMLPKTREQFLKVPLDFTVDCEDEPVGGGCVLLDILTLKGKPLERKTRRERRELLVDFYNQAGFDPKIVRLSEDAVGTAAKRAFLTRIEAEGGEGVIVKNQESQYLGGDAGRAVMFKMKFVSTVSCIVDQVMIGGKRNIGIALLDGLRRIQVGKCSIPVNKEVPKVGAIVEVRYIYAENGSNKLNQPFYIGEREDVALKECVIGQLRYKQQLGDD